MNSLSLKFGNIATEPSFERMFWDLKTFLRHADWHGGTVYYQGYSTHKFSFVKTATLHQNTIRSVSAHWLAKQIPKVPGGYQGHDLEFRDHPLQVRLDANRLHLFYMRQ